MAHTITIDARQAIDGAQIVSALRRHHASQTRLNRKVVNENRAAVAGKASRQGTRCTLSQANSLISPSGRHGYHCRESMISILGTDA